MVRARDVYNLIIHNKNKEQLQAATLGESAQRDMPVPGGAIFTIVHNTRHDKKI
ncbi:MAG: hypothetical protein GY874_05110 [Desulfobacteraceae bacterium]|nr:hypothetical protein [Desulfobacteraceae bacterium]